MSVSVAATEPLATAEVQLQLRVEVLEDGWVTVPVLPLGTPVTSATVNGSHIQLFATERGLAWGAKKAGVYTLVLELQDRCGRLRRGLHAGRPDAPRFGGQSVGIASRDRVSTWR